MSNNSEAERFRVLVPVQDLGSALPRMKVAPTLRRDLALAFARDTVDAALACSAAAEVVVITRDPHVAGAFTDLDVELLPAVESRLVSSVVTAAHYELNDRRPMPTAVLMADLPSLMPAELGSALRRVLEVSWSVYAEDLLAGGTTFFASRRDAFVPCLGARSGAENAAAGSMRIGQDLPGLRCDVDTLEDLKMAKYLGVGVRTSQVLARHPRLRSLRLAA